jgi:hypothetical protein
MDADGERINALVEWLCGLGEEEAERVCDYLYFFSIVQLDEE